MKTVALLLCCASLSWACPKGTLAWRDGVCVVDIKPEGVQADQWVSDEEPPRNQQASWDKAVDIRPATNDKEESEPQIKWAKDHPIARSDDGGKFPK